MNKVILVGRLTRDPEVRYSAGDNSMAIARYGLAVDRNGRRDGSGSDQQTADFLNIVAFGRTGEFAEKYLHKGMRILIEGRIQTGSYTNKEGQKVYTTDIVVDRHEFVDSKSSPQQGGSDQFIPAPSQAAPEQSDAGDGFMNIPDGIEEELPFN